MDTRVGADTRSRTNTYAAVISGVMLAALLAACSGSTGSAGAAGPPGPAGPAGPPGPSSTTAIVVTDPSVTSITGTIKSVTIGPPQLVKFSLADQNGVPLQGLPAADISWTFAKLTPGVNGESSNWQSYIQQTVTPSGCPATSCLTAPAVQATTESSTKGTLVDNGDGTYQYTFHTDITNVPGVTYSATLTHRVGFEIRGLAQANNGPYTFQASTGATTGIFMDEIIETSTCNGCHTQLSAHGGARVDTQYCVMCHNPSTTDPYSGNPLDFKQQIHKIHTGINLPSINPPALPAQNTSPILGQGYWIVGFMKSLNNFNTVLFPQDTRNCTTCHNQKDPNAPQAGEYATVPTIQACGACHDTTTFSGANVTHAGGAVTNAQCTTCHVNPTLPQLAVPAVHVIPDELAAKQFQYIINSVTFTGAAPNFYPVVNFSVVNPTNNNVPYNILTDPTFSGSACTAGAARLAIDIAWETSDYTNWGSAPAPAPASWGQPISLNPLAGAGCPAGSVTPVQQGNGSWTLTSPTPLPPPPALNCANGTPCAPITNVGVVLEGHPGVVTTGPGADSIPVTSTVAYANVSGAAAVPRRVVVSTVKCDVCHYRLELHGNNRNDNTQVCVACHNPASTDVSQRPLTSVGTDNLWEQSLNFRFLIHALHDGSVRAAAGVPTTIYSFGVKSPPLGLPPTSFSQVVFPGQLNDCAMCHNSGTYYPVDDSLVQATTFDTGLTSQGVTTPGNPISTSANMAVCSACHFDTTAQAHMMQNGGSTNVMKDPEGRTLPSGNVETCTICHGPGGVADVAVVHNIPVADR
jgi:OmcA/MtrC family decaheme c-type cytochrome